VRFCRQEAVIDSNQASRRGLIGPDSGLVPIYQTVPPRTPVNKGHANGTLAGEHPRSSLSLGFVHRRVCLRQHLP
jgi:hypothetical protein